jgi:hypothetical protein
VCSAAAHAGLLRALRRDNAPIPHLARRGCAAMQRTTSKLMQKIPGSFALRHYLLHARHFTANGHCAPHLLVSHLCWSRIAFFVRSAYGHLTPRMTSRASAYPLPTPGSWLLRPRRCLWSRVAMNCTGRRHRCHCSTSRCRLHPPAAHTPSAETARHPKSCNASATCSSSLRPRAHRISGLRPCRWRQARCGCRLLAALFHPQPNRRPPGAHIQRKLLEAMRGPTALLSCHRRLAARASRISCRPALRHAGHSLSTTTPPDELYAVASDACR